MPATANTDQMLQLDVRLLGSMRRHMLVTSLQTHGESFAD